MSLNMDKLREFADIYLERKYHKDKDNELTTKIGEMQQALLEHMADEGVNKVSLTGGITLNISELIWPEYGHKQIAIEAIRASGIKGMLEEGFNHNRLASYIREKLKMGEKLPKEFQDKIKANPVQKLVAKKL